MDQATLLWTLAGTVFAGFALFIQKMVAQEGRSSAFNGLFMYGASGVIAFALLPTAEIPIEWPLVAFLGLSAGAIHGYGNFLRIESLKYIDSVLFFPLNKVFAPLLVVVGGIAFFKDMLGPVQYAGIALSLAVPLLLVSSVEHARQKNLRRGIELLAVSTLCSAVSLLVTKQGLSVGSAVLFLLCMSQITGVTASLAILAKQHGAGRAMFVHADRRDIWLGFLSGTISFVSSYCLFEALDGGLVSLVYVIQAHYILIPIILSVWWYNDHINMRKFAAVVVSFLAIGLLAV